MFTQFEFHNPTNLIFGENTFAQLGERTSPFGKKALLVTGRRAMRQTGHLDRAQQLLQDAGLEVTVYDAVPPNPTDNAVDEGANIAVEAGCDIVVGLGGGSSMDTAKGIAVAAGHGRPIREFLESIPGQERPLPTAATLPIVCLTSTAGTSSELTAWAVITITDKKEKNAFGNDFTYPRISIADPELTWSLPPEITAETGIDVLCHAVEAFISTAATPLTDIFACEAIRKVGTYLPRVFADGNDKTARREMMLANCLAGYGLARCGATVMHALEHPVSGHYPRVAHGGGLAALLRPWARNTWPHMPARFARIAALLEPDMARLAPEEAAQNAEHAIARLLDKVNLNIGLNQFGVVQSDIEMLVDDAMRYMMRALMKMPKELTRDDLIVIMEEAL